jgi:hypothetical protein
LSSFDLGVSDLSFFLGLGRQNFFSPHVSLLLAQLSGSGFLDSIVLLSAMISKCAITVLDALTVARLEAWSALAQKELTASNSNGPFREKRSKSR